MSVAAGGVWEEEAAGRRSGGAASRADRLLMRHRQEGGKKGSSVHQRQHFLLTKLLGVSFNEAQGRVFCYVSTISISVITCHRQVFHIRPSASILRSKNPGQCFSIPV